ARFRELKKGFFFNKLLKHFLFFFSTLAFISNTCTTMQLLYDFQWKDNHLHNSNQNKKLFPMVFHFVEQRVTRGGVYSLTAGVIHINCEYEYSTHLLANWNALEHFYMHNTK